MERETIERLAMDMAGGELSDDVCELLRAYLGKHAEEDCWAKEMLALYGECELAIRVKSAPAETVATSAALRRRWRIWSGGMARRAAVIFIAFSLGAGLSQIYDRRTNPVDQGLAGVVHEMPAGVAVDEGGAGGSEFWRKKAVVAVRHGPIRRNTIGQEHGFWEKFSRRSKGDTR